jgi:hypothetical protein
MGGDNLFCDTGYLANVVLTGPFEMEDLMNHKLINQLSAANAAEEDIEELFQDLKFVYENPFDAAIEEAVNARGCVYVEISQSVVH